MLGTAYLEVVTRARREVEAETEGAFETVALLVEESPPQIFVL
jgi:hypothetical protein